MHGYRAHPAGPTPAFTTPPHAVRAWHPLARRLAAGALAAAVGPAGASALAQADLPEAFVARVAALINEYRGHHRLDRLWPADTLARVADLHSRHMADAGQPSHGGFRDRFQQADSDICVENIAAYFDSPEALVDGWRRSPSHDRNLLEPRIVRMGLAARGSYVTFFACR